MPVRLKFLCNSISLNAWNENDGHEICDVKFTVEPHFPKFEISQIPQTHLGELKISGFMSTDFTVGKEYYVDISEAKSVERAK